MSSPSPDGVCVRLYLTTPIYYINGRAAPRPRLHDARRRRAGPLPPARRGRRVLPDGHRRARRQDRPGGRPRRRGARDARRPERDGFRDDWAALGITYDGFIRTTEPRHQAVVQARSSSSSVGPRRDLLRQVRGPVLLRLRALLHREGDRRRQVPGPPDAADLHRGGELLLPDVGVPGLAARATEAHPDVVQPERYRNELLGFLREPLQDLSISRPDEPPPVGHPAAVRRPLRHLRLVRRAPQLRLRPRRGRAPTRFRRVLAARPAPDRQGHPQAPRRSTGRAC